MAKKRVLVRTYAISDGEISGLAREIGALVTTDMADLSVYGISAATVAELEVLRDDFHTIFSEAFVLSRQISATQLKNKLRDETETTVRSLAMRAETKLGSKSPAWARFGLGAISLEVDDTFLRTARRAHRVATLFQPDLASEGIDAPWLLALKNQADALSDALDAQDDAALMREATTRDRIHKGNALHAMTMRLASYGQDYYYSRNSTKYGQYKVVETTKTGGQRTGNIGPAEVKNIDFVNAVSTDIFRFKNKGEHAFEVYFSDTTGGLPTGEVFAVDAGGDVKMKATELGYSSTKIYLMLRNAGTGETRYEVFRK